jgi:hypothetical protein
MLRTIGPFVVGRETEIASSSEGGKTSQLLCAEIDTITNSIYDSFGTLIWLEVEDQEPQIIGRYSPLTHFFIPAKGTQ